MKRDVIGSIRQPTERFMMLLRMEGQEQITDMECARLMDGDNWKGRVDGNVGQHWGQRKMQRGDATISEDYKRMGRVAYCETGNKQVLCIE